MSVSVGATNGPANALRLAQKLVTFSPEFHVNNANILKVVCKWSSFFSFTSCNLKLLCFASSSFNLKSSIGFEMASLISLCQGLTASGDSRRCRRRSPLQSNRGRVSKRRIRQFQHARSSHLLSKVGIEFGFEFEFWIWICIGIDLGFEWIWVSIWIGLGFDLSLNLNLDLDELDFGFEFV
jgi:hypothetical protein